MEPSFVRLCLTMPVWAPSQEGHGSIRAPATLFRVAILLVGDAFRSIKDHGATGRVCDSSSIDAQREASVSYVDRVAHPLEALGATVDVIMTFPMCATRNESGPRHDQAAGGICEGGAVCKELSRRMRDWFSPRRVVSHAIRSKTLADGWLQAHRFLKRHMSASNVTYDYVLQSRHDLRINRDITGWRANLSKLVFEESCVDCTYGPEGRGGSCQCAREYGWAERLLRTVECMRCAQGQ